MQIDHIPEWQLTPADDDAIADLLSRCFDTDFGGRSYFKTRHHLRQVMREAGQIVAHMALQFRAMRLGGKLITVSGLAEVATHPDHRGKGHAQALLQAAIATAKAARVDHFLLFGDAKLYTAAGFRTVHNPMIFLELEGARTGPVKHEAAEVLMVLPIGASDWDPRAELDLLGGLF